ASEQIKEEKQQKELLDNLPHGAALYAYDGEQLSVIHFNKRYWELIEREPADYTSPSVLSAVYPDDRIVITQEIDAAIRQKRDAVCDYRILCGKGVYKPFHVVGRIIPKEEGVYAIYASYTPISNEVMSYQQMLPVVLSTIMDSTTDLAFAKDKNFRYICVSRAFADMAGIDDPKDIVGKTDYEVFESETAEKFRRDDTQLLESGKSIVDMVESIPSADGIPHYSSTSKYLLRESNGSVIGLYGIGRDITEYRDAFSKLKLLTDSIPGGIATYELAGERIRLIYRNDGFCKLFEATRDNNDPGILINPAKWVFSEDLDELQSQLDALVKRNTPMDCVYRIHTKNGGYRWISHKAVAADRRGGKLIVHAILQDVTDQHDIMDQLRQSEEENLLAIQLGGNIICHYTVADKSLTMSAEVAASFGLPEKTMDVPYEPVRLGFVSKECAEAYVDFFEAILHGSKAGTVLFQQQYLGEWRWMEARSSTIFSETGDPVKAIITFIDVTERLEKEAAYKRWQQSLANRKPESYTLIRSNLSKDVSLDVIEGSLLNIGFSKDKHSFNERTDLYAEQCVFTDDRERYRAFANLETLLANYYRGKRADSLEYREKLEDGSTRWLLLSIELVEYPNSNDVEAYLMYEDINEAKQAELQTKEMSENDPLTGVYNRATFVSKVKQTVQASNENAKHALIMPDVDGFKTVNDVFGHGAGDQTLIEVADILRSILRRGDLVGRIGGDEFVVFLSDIPNSVIAANKAKQICALTRKSFSPEVRISCSVGVAVAPLDGKEFDTLYKKADLALYYVKGSGKDNYAFYRESMKNQHLEEEEYAPVPVAVGKPEKKRRMLIVDDNAIDHALMANIFKDEFIIEKAKNGSSALIRLRHYGSAISVVLLDLMMPNMDGFAVLKQMQSYPELQNIPVIIVSGDDSRDTCLQTIRCGATDFVTKPVDPDLLRIRVRSAISKAENERLRATNSLLEQKNFDVTRYEAALECSGVAIIECDWLSGEFIYDPSIGNYIAGTYDNRKFWYLLLADMVADTLTVKKMQELVHRIADDRTLTNGSIIVQLKTPKGKSHEFRMNVHKLPNDFQLTTKLIITLLDMHYDPDQMLS
ncbi:MAG: diguanylate cyclase, partial [Eubacteriales bacterium]|nr:diguanylate cyclase [Eubacteriales bacterium]